jgi:hypothetical protein
VLKALVPIGRNYVTLAERGGSFTVESGDGCWSGVVLEYGKTNAMRVLAVRTFIN